ncbi:hypothetical protein [Pseudomonas xanthosomatis]|uniref:hypothetical protein n=1 Tax=Pseudomonas xanthosomatis TaxID=2842356 RepID=UPI0035155043
MQAKMDTYRAKGDATFDAPCKVTIEGDAITIAYEDDGQTWYYKGKAKGLGHYELRAEHFQGRATLHAFEDSRILEGSWIEEDRRGMWRIVCQAD